MKEIIKDNPNIVIVGAWNTAILSPNWLRLHFPDIIKSEKIKIDASFGPSSSFVFNLDDIKLFPSSNRLMIAATKKTQSTYEKVKKLAQGILELLPHTPITSIGHNIAYNVRDNNIRILTDDHDLQEKEIYREILNKDIIARNIKHTIPSENHYLNIEYRISRDEKIIDFNFHYDNNSQELLSKSVNSFVQNIEYSNNLIKKLVV